MSMLPYPCSCCMFMSMLHVCLCPCCLIHVHAACSCPCCTFVYVHAACPCQHCMSLSTQHVPVDAVCSFLCCMYSLCCMSMSVLHFHSRAACPWTCSISMSKLHVYGQAACPYFCIHDAISHTCCMSMSMLYVCTYRVGRSIVDYFLRTRRRRCWGL